MSNGRLSLRALFPSATAEQLHALVNRLPVPPSPEWIPGSPSPVAGGTVNAAPEVLLDTNPLVTAIMPFGEATRAKRAQRCINRFLLQTYENKELVVINTSGKKLTEREHPAVRELMIDESLMVGAMRNLGLREARGKWVTTWDDDDLPSYHYVEHMMHRRVEGRGLALRYQIRTSVVNSNAFMHAEDGGIPSTLFFQPSPELHYPEADVGDTKLFYDDHFAGKAVVINNNLYPATCLHIAVHHGLNLTNVEDFMHDLAAPSRHKRIYLNPSEQEHLRMILLGSGVEMKTQSSGAQPPKTQETVG